MAHLMCAISSQDRCAINDHFSSAIACPQAIQFNELDATKKTLTNSFASLDVYKHVLRKSLASFNTMLQRQCTKQSFFHVISHKQTKVNNMLLKINSRSQCTWHEHTRVVSC